MAGPPGIARTEGMRLFDRMQFVDVLRREVDKLEISDDAFRRDRLRKDYVRASGRRE